MGRLFWQFFLTIWLTIIGAIVVIVVTNSFLKILPPKGEMRDFRERFALETTSDLIRKGKVSAAGDYLASIASPPHPTQLSYKLLPDRLNEEACIGRTEMTAFAFDRQHSQCYLIEVLAEQITFLEAYAPPFLPPLAALLTSSISAFFLARYLVKPVMTLRAGLSALAGGNFGVRIGRVRGRWMDEVTALSHDFDVTAGKLEELQEAGRRLFHDVSHELRSPLSRMQAAFGLLKQNPAKLDAVMPRMEREIERLDGLVEEILTLARLGSSKSLVIERQMVDVVDLIGAIIDDAAFEAEPRGIGIVYSGVEGFVAEINGELIYRAIENVMRNAVKYSDEGSTIAVSARRSQESGLSIEISNVGAFVAPEDVERIFEPFTRLLENDAAVGHGLGLAITRRAVESHGGHVLARSRDGGGLTVVLYLPV
jgi:two-component system, OmpR family, sensor kinase